MSDQGTPSQGRADARGAAVTAPAVAQDPIVEGRDAGDDPCLPLRRLVEARTEVAERAAVASQDAAARLDEARSRRASLVAELRRAETDLAARRLDAARETADGLFSTTVRTAHLRSEVEAAVATWLADLDRITDEASSDRDGVERARQAAAEMVPELERLAAIAEASAARAEAAQHACSIANAALDGCLAAAARRAEALALAAAGQRAAALPPAGAGRDVAPPIEATAGEATAGDAGPGSDRLSAAAATMATALAEAPTLSSVAAAAPSSAPPASLALVATAAMPPPAAALWPPLEAQAPGAEAEEVPPELDLGAARQAAIVRLVRGDGTVLVHLAATLAAGDQEGSGRWQALLSSLVEAIVGAAVDDGWLDFPDEHPFWALFTADEAREVARCLTVLGYGYDASRGFSDERVPGQRELSLAVGTAGLNPVRIRRWPSREEMAELFSGVRVVADAFLVARSPTLGLAEVQAMLGRRAGDLSALWPEWGRLRPLLLSID